MASFVKRLSKILDHLAIVSNDQTFRVQLTSTDYLRDPNAQKQYRQQSRSNFKDYKQAAHYLSLQIVDYIQSKIPGPKPSNLKKAANEMDNFRMVLIETNKKKHEEIDKTIQNIWKGVKSSRNNTEYQLNQAEAKRARQQSEIIQKSDLFNETFKQTARYFYKKLSAKDNKAIWDDRKNANKFQSNIKKFKRKMDETFAANKNKYNDKQVGTYRSKGSADGSEIYEGPRGGRYRIDKNGKKVYLPKNYDQKANENNIAFKSDNNTNNIHNSDDSYSSYGDRAVGTYSSHGSANGSTVYEGSRGGHYRINSSGNKSYI
eukprot:257477_1